MAHSRAYMRNWLHGQLDCLRPRQADRTSIKCYPLCQVPQQPLFEGKSIHKPAVTLGLMYMISGIYGSPAPNAGRNSSRIICQGKLCGLAIAHGTSERCWLLGKQAPWQCTDHWTLSTTNLITREGFSNRESMCFVGFYSMCRCQCWVSLNPWVRAGCCRSGVVDHGKPRMLLSLMPAQQRVGGQSSKPFRIFLDGRTLHFDSRWATRCSLSLCWRGWGAVTNFSSVAAYSHLSPWEHSLASFCGLLAISSAVLAPPLSPSISISLNFSPFSVSVFHFQNIFKSLFLYLSLLVFLSLLLPLSLCISFRFVCVPKFLGLCVSVSLCLLLPIFLSLPISISISPLSCSLSFHLASLSLALSLSVHICLSLCLLPFLIVSLPLCESLCMSLFLCFFFSISMSLSLSWTLLQCTVWDWVPGGL